MNFSPLCDLLLSVNVLHFLPLSVCLTVSIHEFCSFTRFAFVCQCNTVCLNLSLTFYLSVCLAVYLSVCVSEFMKFARRKKFTVAGSQERICALIYIIESRNTFIYIIGWVIEQDCKLYMTDFMLFFLHKTATATLPRVKIKGIDQKEKM